MKRFSLISIARTYMKLRRENISLTVDNCFLNKQLSAAIDQGSGGFDGWTGSNTAWTATRKQSGTEIN